MHDGGRPVATGVANAVPVSVPPGAARLLVDLDPPAEIGPLPLASGAHLRVRIVDFPNADPPVRESAWRVLPGREAARDAEATAR